MATHRPTPSYGNNRAGTPDSSPSPTPSSVGTPPPSFLSSSVSSLWGGLVRRFSTEQSQPTTPPSSFQHARTFDASSSSYTHSHGHNNGLDGVYTPPYRHHTASPMKPPPLEPLQLNGFSTETSSDARLLTTSIAEELRIMVPARLSIVDEWNLVYSLEQDGASLATLYDKAARYSGKRVGFVLVVKDLEGGTFGAYLSDYPHPRAGYFGTGECFLWRASVLAGLPPRPDELMDGDGAVPRSATILGSEGTPGIRFKAFPYSGVNEYYMLCESHFLSVGAGDGKYGLWLNDGLEKGVSSTCLTFGNERLSDEGEKFGVLGVELWVIGG
ncbi:hypothetical protein OQA88_8795 [Cercophora sp. LCS_1]